MDGYAGKLLNVDLGKETGGDFVVPEEVVHRYLGAKGLAVWLLYHGLEPMVDALSPENVLIMTTGPLAGLQVPGFNFLSICTKSPLTGTVVNAPLGGDFAGKLRSCGYDGLIIRGRASGPSMLDISHESWALRDASALWGSSTAGVMEVLESSNTCTLCIGPAGENLVRFSSIASGEHVASRGGCGAVMGSKMLKAIRAGGKARINVFDRDRLEKPVENMKQQLKPWDAGGGAAVTGVFSTLAAAGKSGVVPARNFALGVPDRMVRSTSEKLRSQVRRRAHLCHGCPVECTIEMKLSTRSRTLRVRGPGYQAFAMLGSNLMINDIEAVTRINFLCYLLGMDPVSLGGTLAAAMELSEMGRMYLPLLFGSPREVERLLPLIARREGPGNELADGSARLIQAYGHPESGITVKGMEVPGFDPRGCWGQGLEYATSPSGAVISAASMVACEVLGRPAKLRGPGAGGKVDLTVFSQNLSNSLACLGLCPVIAGHLISVPGWAGRLPLPVAGALVSAAPRLSTRMIDLFNIHKALSFVTGIRYDRGTLLKTGERVFNLERLFNLREGFTSRDDMLPMRFLGEPFREGPLAGKVVPLSGMLLRYYRARGWTDVGIPTLKLLRKLGLESNSTDS